MRTPEEESEAILDFATAGRQNFELPHLETSQAEAQNPFWQWLEEWLKNLLPNRNLNLDTSYLTPENLYAAAIFICAALITCILALIIWRYLQKSRQSRLQYQPSLQIKTEHEDLLLAMQEALNQGRYDEWGRLRWQLFLQRTRQASSTTPQEYLRHDPSFEKEFIDSLYFQMFHQASGDKQIAVIEQRLSAREQLL
ncbi:MAG: hypothetical protein ACOH5I_01345 [Oligoflexus sp.]